MVKQILASDFHAVFRNQNLAFYKSLLYNTRVWLHLISGITSSCVVSFLHSMLRFCCDKTLFEEVNIEEKPNSKF